MTLQIVLSPDQVEELATEIAKRIQPPGQAPVRRYLSVVDAAEEFGVSESSLRRALNAGMPKMKFGSRIVIDIERAAQWLAEQAELCEGGNADLERGCLEVRNGR